MNVVYREVEYDRRSRGFSCDSWVDAPGQQWKDFTHAVDELVMVIEGQVEFEIGGEIVHPSIGEELLIPAGVKHSVRINGATVAKWLYRYKGR